MDQYAAVFGRLHLLILHLPIGLVIGIVALELAALLRRKGGWTVPPALLWLNAAMALVAALSGLKLSQESGYGGTTLTIHLWLGISVAVVAIAVAMLRAKLAAEAPPGRVAAYRASLAGMLLLVVLAGHYGGTMTHGEGFVLAPIRAGGGELVADTKPVDFSQLGPGSEEGFAHVAPILAQSCVSCHSGSGAKAGLALDSFQSLKRGSEIGEVVVAEAPSDSELLRRITLPEGDPGRMPPEGRRQLSPEQVALIRNWVLGAGPEGTGAAATADNDAAIESLRATLAHAMPVAQDSDLLWIDMSFAQPPLTEQQIIDLLRPLAPRIADLTLSRCAVTDEFVALAKQMPKLRRLALQETQVTDTTVAALAEHASLEELVLTRTAVTDASIEHLKTMPALKSVYLWGSLVTADEISRLAAACPGLRTDIGEFAEATEVLAELKPEFVDAGPKPGGASVSLAPINSVCPVSGTAVNPKYLVVHSGKVIGFCCNNCPQQFWADPDKFAAKLKP